MIDYDEDEEIIAYCDVCGEPLTEEDCNVIENFGGEGGRGYFCTYHYEQMGYSTSYRTSELFDDESQD
ncbi:hypothetical protein [Maridesulfovibrio sp.]|uniref:hypothetical protein n=1 Tax=unclassified Maridesulfovibrio TaxID=2794999 RepID=UPI003B000E63